PEGEDREPEHHDQQDARHPPLAELEPLERQVSGHHHSPVTSRKYCSRLCSRGRSPETNRPFSASARVIEAACSSDAATMRRSSSRVTPLTQVVCARISAARS